MILPNRCQDGTESVGIEFTSCLRHYLATKCMSCLLLPLTRVPHRTRDKTGTFWWQFCPPWCGVHSGSIGTENEGKTFRRHSAVFCYFLLQFWCFLFDRIFSTCLKRNGHLRPFCIYFWPFQTKPAIVPQIIVKLFALAGFELMTFWLWVSSHNHLTRELFSILLAFSSLLCAMSALLRG